MRRLGLGLFLAVVLAGCSKKSPHASGDWNEGEIQWLPFEQALAAAQEQHKPICLIFFTTWCPHCKNYSKVFADSRVVEKAKSFAMVRLDEDRAGPLAARYAPDGHYIPRTMFLDGRGQLQPGIFARTDKFKYFYDESDPRPLLDAMDRALATVH